jgi:LPXTG-motif cell wall-anchored protein
MAFKFKDDNQTLTFILIGLFAILALAGLFVVAG